MQGKLEKKEDRFYGLTVLYWTGNQRFMKHFLDFFLFRKPSHHEN
jgi:hypothetical protein